MAQWNAGEAQQLLRAATAMRYTTSPQSNASFRLSGDRKLLRTTKLAKEVSSAKAVLPLLSKGIHQITDRLQNRLLEKHPQSVLDQNSYESDDDEHSASSCAQLIAYDIIAVISRFPRKSNGGWSGLTTIRLRKLVAVTKV